MRTVGQRLMVLSYMSMQGRDLTSRGGLTTTRLCSQLLTHWTSDLMAFPVSLPDDGLIDIAVMSSVSLCLLDCCHPLSHFLATVITK